jgi:hypothetical protein
LAKPETSAATFSASSSPSLRRVGVQHLGDAGDRRCALGRVAQPAGDENVDVAADFARQPPY